MRSPALAVGWEFRQRHRWGLVALAGYVLFVAAFKLVILGPDTIVRLDPPDGRAATVIVPLAAMFMYVLAAFSFGLDGDLGARESIYPSRMFALPVTTAALTGWPMVYGTAAMASLWLVTALLARWPWGEDLPLLWPALLGAAFLAWTQALMWMPYGLRGLRVVVAVLWLAALDAAVLVALHYNAREAVMVAILAPQLPVAYLVARIAVGRARRGEVPDWVGSFAGIGHAAYAAPLQRDGFSSPARAERWFEWRRQGWSLPAWIGMLLPFFLALLFANRDTPALVVVTVFAVLLAPPFLAAFVAAAASKTSAPATDAYGVTPFIATKPLTSAALIAAKLHMAAWSTGAAWLVVLVALPVGLTLSGTWPVVIDRARLAIDTVGTPRAIAAGLLVIGGLVASTWKQLVQGLCIGMTGREWLVKSSVLLRLSLPIVVLPVAQWVVDHRAITWLDHVPLALAGLVVLKMCAAAWVATRLHRHRLLSDRALVFGALCWLAAVLALYGLLVWLVSTPPLVPRHVPALVAILAIPLVRLSAAPLALAWNRYRGAGWPSTTTTHRGTMVVRVVLVLISLPAAGAALEAGASVVRNRSNGVLVSSGQEREYLLYVPKSYDRTTPTPLVVSLHGAGGWPVHQRDTSQWNHVADREGFLVVYPSGATAGGRRIWNVDGAGLAPDIRFISELIDTLMAAYNIDSTRVYADGLSNGGDMAFVLSCALSDRIAAVGMVAAAHLTPWSACADQRAVPMIAFHGTADRITPYAGGTSWAAPGAFANIPAWTSMWARRNRCEPTPLNRRCGRTSHDSSTPTVPTMLRWCSTRSTAEAIPGPVASRCRTGWPGPRAAASTPRARCGRSSARIVFRAVSGSRRIESRRAPSAARRHGRCVCDGRAQGPEPCAAGR